MIGMRKAKSMSSTNSANKSSGIVNVTKGVKAYGIEKSLYPLEEGMKPSTTDGIPDCISLRLSSLVR